jgi:hypothetical protein
MAIKEEEKDGVPGKGRSNKAHSVAIYVCMV